MSQRDQTGLGKLDHVDRRSQLGTSRAMRARDVSRPDDRELAEALAALDARPPATSGRGTGTSKPLKRKRTTAAEGRRSARTD